MKTIFLPALKIIVLSFFFVILASSPAHAASIAYYSEMIYTENGEGYLRATDIKTGQDIWTKFSYTNHLTAKVKNLKT